MIKNTAALRELENSLIRKEGRLPFKKAVKIFTQMWSEAVRLAVLPPKEPLEGIEIDIRIAKALNSCLKKSSPV